MTVLLLVVGRELLLLALVAALGSGLARWLPREMTSEARIALVPLLGLCVGVAATTPLLEYWPASSTAWVLPAVAAGSLVLAVLGRRRQPRASVRWGERAGAWARICLVALVVAGPITLALAQRASTGPVTYEVYDAIGYVAETDGAMHQSLEAAQHVTPPYRTLVEEYWNWYASGVQQLDIVPLSANVDALFGLGGTDTQSPFLVSMLIVGAMGMYGAVLALRPRARLAATVAGSLFGGPFFLQLFFDGSQAAIVGLGLVVPVLVLAYLSARERSIGGLVVTAIVFSGLLAVYPIFVPPLALAVGIVLGAWVVLNISRRHWSRRELVSGLLSLCGVVAIAMAIDPLASYRDVRYWVSLLRGGFVYAGFPQYHLGAGVVPGWLFQMHGLYSVAFGPQSILNDPLASLVLPLAAIVVVGIGIRHRPALLLLLPLVVVCAGLARYEVSANSCSYCEDRNLLPVEPVLIVLFAIGVGTITAVRSRARRIGATILVVAVLAGATSSAVHERSRFLAGSYMLPVSVKRLVAKIPPSARAVDLEGFDEGTNPPGEQPAVYELVYEHFGNRVSLPADYNDRGAISYFGSYPFPGPQFHPAYDYVLTRLPGVTTARKVLAGEPGVALERRTSALDVSLDYGLITSLLPADDPAGDGWVAGPVHFVVAGRSPKRPYVSAQFALPPTGVAVGKTPGEVLDPATKTLRVCLATIGSGAVHAATVNLPANVGIRLTGMWATSGHCLSGF